MVWAWERPEDLRFIDPRQVGVAFLAKTIYLTSEEVVARPRLQPLRVPAGAALVAVARIEPDRLSPPKFGQAQRRQAASAIAELARLPGVVAVQVDFDATRSQHSFYKDLLYDLRQQLLQGTGLSMTALASWCLYDDWVSALAVEEAVPMLFRMGADDREVRLYLDRGQDFRPSRCRLSLGLSTDEPWPRLPSGRRVYVFHPRPWSPEAIRTITEEVNRWQ
jgi:hypothetical protein